MQSLEAIVSENKKFFKTRDGIDIYLVETTGEFVCDVGGVEIKSTSYPALLIKIKRAQAVPVIEAVLIASGARVQIVARKKPSGASYDRFGEAVTSNKRTISFGYLAVPDADLEAQMAAQQAIYDKETADWQERKTRLMGEISAIRKKFIPMTDALYLQMVEEAKKEQQ